MPKRISSSIRRATKGASSRQIKATGERRTLLRLRDLCDEVAASFRAARGRELLSDAERTEARQLLSQLTPAMGRANG